MKALAAAAVMVMAAVPVTARTADYSVTEAQMAADAEALNVRPFPALPAKGDFDIVAEDLGKLDQQLKILGIFCRAWKVDNPLSVMVGRVLGMIDRDGQLAAGERRPLIRFKAQSALSTMRCVEVKEMTTQCLTRTSIQGEATVERTGARGRGQPVTIEFEHQQSVGVCGGLARGAAISGRGASIRLAERLRELAAE